MVMRFYKNRLLAINLCQLAFGGQTEETCGLFELKQSQRKSSQIDSASGGWLKETQGKNLRRLTRA